MTCLHVHVIPVGDELMHEAQHSCWCHPLMNEDGVVVHNARDCREALERQDGEQHGGWINIGEWVAHP